MLDAPTLAARFPWLNTDALALGSVGERWEGFFDPWQLLHVRGHAGCVPRVWVWRARLFMGVSVCTCVARAPHPPPPHPTPFLSPLPPSSPISPLPSSPLPQWFNAQARAAGVDFVEGGVQGVGMAGGRVASVSVFPRGASQASTLHCGALVNACGAWSGRLAALAGLPGFPVQPRRRVVFVVTSEQPLPEGTPLVVDPCGVYFRPEGPAGQRRFLCGVSPEVDPDCEGTGTDLDTTARWRGACAWGALGWRGSCAGDVCAGVCVRVCVRGGGVW